MNGDRCDTEIVLLEALRAGRWPDACDEELRAHVARCSICAEVAMVAEALRQDDASARAEASLPTPGLVWWKAQIRARRAAAERAAEPITIAVSVGWICAAFSLLGVAVWQWPRIASWWHWFRVLPSESSLWSGGAFPHLWTANLPLIMSMFLCLALVSFVLYLVFAKE